MSYQATAWASNQQVGNPARKLLLMILAEHADKHGYCWPSQGLLAKKTGMSLDTVQRQTKKLRDDGFLSVTRPPKRRGQWQTFIYQLKINDQSTRPQNAARLSQTSENASEALDTSEAARSDTAEQQSTYGSAVGGGCQPVSTGCQLIGTPAPNAVRPSRNDASPSRIAKPHPDREPSRIAMRSNPSIEQSIEHSSEHPIEHPRVKAVSDAVARRQAWQWDQSTEVVQNRIAQRLGGWGPLMQMSEQELNRITDLERNGQLDDACLREAIDRMNLGSIHSG